MSIEPCDHYVYRAWDEDLTLLYIGCTNDTRRRWQQHFNQAEKPWFSSGWRPYVHTFTVEGPYSKTEARRLEDQAILTEGPVFNAFEPRNKEHLHHVMRVARRNAHRTGKPYEGARDRVLAREPGRPQKYLAHRASIAKRSRIRQAA